LYFGFLGTGVRWIHKSITKKDTVILEYAAKGKNRWTLSASGTTLAEVKLKDGQCTATITRPLTNLENACLSSLMLDVTEGNL
jgi:hypothetical protein